MNKATLDFTEKSRGLCGPVLGLPKDYLDFTRLKFALFYLPKGFFRKTHPCAPVTTP